MNTQTTSQQLDEIQFSQNWNKKLGCEYFTTLRLPGNKYYPGNLVKIIHKGTFLYRAEILSIKKIWLRELDDFTAYQDTGYSAKKTIEMLIKMYPTYDFNKYPLLVVLCKQGEY